MEPSTEETKSTGTRWNICVDGSAINWSSFYTVFNNLRKSDDYTIVSHVHCDTKTYLDMKFKPDNIKQDYEAKMIGVHQSKWELVWRRKDSKRSTQEIITNLAEEYRTDVLVLGYHGRKGPKEDPTLLGSNVDLIAKEPICPLLVIKNEELRKDKEGNGYRFVVCMDGREKSYKSLDTTIKLMDKENDEVIILTVTRSMIDCDKIESNTNDILEEAEVKHHKFELLERDHDEKYFEALVDYINIDDTPYIDFVVLANRGVYHKAVIGKDKYLGKVAKQILLNSKANVLLVP
mmetsp:Transcript_27218/g.24107  ORF Transcript_27218/g.24107 Transcript_27218/m.24107 type:complete len:291 (-) Transcript_27218:38-910(-)